MQQGRESSSSQIGKSLLSLLKEALINDTSLDPVRVLLSTSPNSLQVDAVDENGETPLHIAVTLRDGLDIIKRLLELGADCRTADKEQQLPIHRAAHVYRNQHVVKLLIEEGGKQQCYCPDVKGRTSLHIAALASRLEIVNCLVEKSGSHINAVDNEGNTALHLACTRFAITPGYAECQIIKTLLKSGANPALINKAGKNANELAFPQQPSIVAREGEESLKSLQEIFALLSLASGQSKGPSSSNKLEPEKAQSNQNAISSPSNFKKADVEDATSGHKRQQEYTTLLNKLRELFDNVLAKDQVLTDKYHHHLKKSNPSLPRIHSYYKRYLNLYNTVFSQVFDTWLLTPEEILLQEDAMFLPRLIESFDPKIATVRREKNSLQQQQDLLEGNTVYRDVYTGQERKLTVDTAPLPQLTAIFGKQQVKEVQSLSSQGRQEKVNEIKSQIAMLDQKERQFVAAQAFYNEIGQRVSCILVLRRLMALSTDIDKTTLAVKQLLQDRALKTARPLLLEIQQLLPRYQEVSNSDRQAVAYCKELEPYLQWWLHTDLTMVSTAKQVEAIHYFHKQYNYIQSYIRTSLEEGKVASNNPPAFTSHSSHHTMPLMPHVTSNIRPMFPNPAETQQEVQWPLEATSLERTEPSGITLEELQSMYGEDFAIQVQERSIEIALPDPQDERYDIPLFQTLEPLRIVLQDFEKALQADIAALSNPVPHEHVIQKNKLILTFTCSEHAAAIAAHLKRKNFTLSQPVVTVSEELPEEGQATTQSTSQSAVGTSSASWDFFQPRPVQPTSAREGQASTSDQHGAEANRINIEGALGYGV